MLAELTIESLAAGGDGVARHDGLVVFTPRTVPGDRVRADVRVEGRVGRGRLLEVLTPSADRVPPACEHFAAPDRCGGCPWQQVSLPAQRAAKQRMVADAFARIAKQVVDLPPLVAGAPWRYRRTLTLAIRRDGPAVHAGLRAFDDPEAVFPLRDCPITDPAVLAAWREVLAAAAHLPQDRRLRGTVRRVDDASAFVLEGGRTWDGLAAFLAAVPSIGAVWWQPDGGRRRRVADRAGDGTPGASFAQVNPAIAADLRQRVVALVGSHVDPGARARVVDAFSGAGDTAALLAAAGHAVVAIELDREASAWAGRRLAAPSRAVAGRVEDLLPRHLPADVVLLNPPRAGVDARVTATLRATPPRAILYVSCDPATLARDVARLGPWRVRSLTCFDMFPQTAHVETLCELVPEAA